MPEILDDEELDTLDDAVAERNQAAADAAQRAEERKQEEIAAYCPPKPQRGQFVRWFHMADTNSKPTICIVEEVTGRSLKLYGMCGPQRGEVISYVPHVTDPNLKYNEQIRRNAGCWEFTESDINLNKRFEAVYAEMRSMAKTLVKLQNAAGVPVTNHVKAQAAEKRKHRKLMEALCIHHRLDINTSKATDEELTNLLNAKNIPIQPLNANG